MQVRDAQEAIERLEREVAASNKLAEDLAANKTRLEDTRKSAAQAEEEHRKVIQELQVPITRIYMYIENMIASFCTHGS